MDKNCGLPCKSKSKIMGPSICDGKGSCVAAELNPCEVHGCEGKNCGQKCLMGDMRGWCDATGNCGFKRDVKCSNIIIFRLLFFI